MNSLIENRRTNWFLDERTRRLDQLPPVSRRFHCLLKLKPAGQSFFPTVFFCFLFYSLLCYWLRFRGRAEAVSVNTIVRKERKERKEGREEREQEKEERE